MEWHRERLYLDDLTLSVQLLNRIKTDRGILETSLSVEDFRALVDASRLLTEFTLKWGNSMGLDPRRLETQFKLPPRRRYPVLEEVKRGSNRG